MSFLSPNQQCQRMEGKSITFHGLDHPKLTWESFNLVIDNLGLLVSLREGFQASHQASDASIPLDQQSDNGN